MLRRYADWVGNLSQENVLHVAAKEGHVDTVRYLLSRLDKSDYRDEMQVSSCI